MDPQIRLLLEIVYEATEDGQSYAQIVFCFNLIGRRSRHTNREAGWLEYFCLLGILWQGLPRHPSQRPRNIAVFRTH